MTPLESVKGIEATLRRMREKGVHPLGEESAPGVAAGALLRGAKRRTRCARLTHTDKETRR
jgi:hypothetical protein